MTMMEPPVTPKAPLPVLVGEAATPGRPAIVTTGIVLFYASFVAGLVNSTLGSLERNTVGNSPGLFIGGMVLGICLFGGLVFAASKRKNWARITLLVLCVINALACVLGIGILLAVSPVRGIMIVLQAVLQITASVLLFLPAASAWYRNRN